MKRFKSRRRRGRGIRTFKSYFASRGGTRL